MQKYNVSKSSYFYAIGLSYKKADADIRGHFSLSEEGKLALLNQAKENNIESLVVTSTCNRTEIYGFAQHPFQLIKLLCDNTRGTVEEFQEVAYIYKNKEAISHMFRVGSGLDSQILGDFEIISQLKISAKLSRKHGLLNPFSERLINAVIQASNVLKMKLKSHREPLRFLLLLYNTFLMKLKILPIKTFYSLEQEKLVEILAKT
ncbi:glutamyl-tRNA reductase [Algibacter lectus]|uniref:Glutamyl-tRNA reductase n=1 Tax=Algibacter lectus TaxID=221126 RepID=A0A090VCM7_9FLAO|nr:glutamyl-tRNA reductase [Algibacter lectus]